MCAHLLNQLPPFGPPFKYFQGLRIAVTSEVGVEIFDYDPSSATWVSLPFTPIQPVPGNGTYPAHNHLVRIAKDNKNIVLIVSNLYPPSHVYVYKVYAGRVPVQIGAWTDRDDLGQYSISISNGGARIGFSQSLPEPQQFFYDYVQDGVWKAAGCFYYGPDVDVKETAPRYQAMSGNGSYVLQSYSLERVGSVPKAGVIRVFEATEPLNDQALTVSSTMSDEGRIVSGQVI